MLLPYQILVMPPLSQACTLVTSAAAFHSGIRAKDTYDGVTPGVPGAEF
jgi:hypothetical protein